MKQIKNNGCVTFQTEKGFKGFNIRKSVLVSNSKYLDIFKELKIDVI